MFPFIETLKIVDGKLQHPNLHLQRIQNTCLEYYGEAKDLDPLLQQINRSAFDQKEKTKLTIQYNLHQHDLSSSVYHIKKIETLFMVVNNELDYHLKFAERKIFDTYSQKAGVASEVLIIQNDRFTDATYANLAFWNGTDWHTPRYPLLKGTKRKFLLSQSKIIEHDIQVSDLHQYQKVSLINAMLELGDVELPVSKMILYDL